jgi:hypothetical protein
VNARVVSLTREDSDASSMVEGKILICDKSAKILMDPCATHSFITLTLVLYNGLESIEAPRVMIVSTSLGKQMYSDKVLPICTIVVGIAKNDGRPYMTTLRRL